VTLHSSRELIQIRGITPRTKAPTAQWYESSRWSPQRSWIWDPVQDAKADLDRFTRYELNKRAESLWKNSPIIRAVIRRMVTLIIGVGAFPTPKSSSKEFNAELRSFLKTRLRRPCVDNKKPFGNYQRVKMTGIMKHGESFTVKVHDPRTGQDKIQGFEWHRCSGGGGKPGSKNQMVFGNSDSYMAKATDKTGGGDGVEFYETGYPKAYRFLGMDQPVDESLVVHHAIIERDEQVRGETILAAAINTAHDVKDILALEKAAVKDASSKQDIIQTATGDFDPESMLKLPYGEGTGNFPTPMSLPQDDTARTQYYNAKFQGGAVILKTGDKYTPYEPKRPGSAWEGFMAFLANLIVLSTGLPPSLVLPIDIGGTDIRRDLQIAQKLVAIFQSDFENDLQEIAEYFIHGGIEDRVFKTPVPPDWNELEWHFTGSLTVDRNKDQDRREAVEAGLMSWDEYWGQTAQDGDEEWQKINQEVRRRRKDIAGIEEDAPFESAREFKEFLSLSMTTSESAKETGTLEDDAPPPKKSEKKKGAKKTNPQSA